MNEEIKIGSLWIKKDPSNPGRHYNGLIDFDAVVAKVIDYNPESDMVRIISKTAFGYADLLPESMYKVCFLGAYEDGGACI